MVRASGCVAQTGRCDEAREEERGETHFKKGFHGVEVRLIFFGIVRADQKKPLFYQK